MQTLYTLAMWLLMLLPLALLLLAFVRYYRFVTRPPTEEELRLAADHNVCHNCGMSLEKRWAHCPHCGAKLDGTVEAEEGGRRKEEEGRS
jgi:predicted amidophosphoribosyltransferase